MPMVGAGKARTQTDSKKVRRTALGPKYKKIGQLGITGQSLNGGNSSKPLLVSKAPYSFSPTVNVAASSSVGISIGEIETRVSPSANSGIPNCSIAAAVSEVGIASATAVSVAAESQQQQQQQSAGSAAGSGAGSGSGAGAQHTVAGTGSGSGAGSAAAQQTGAGSGAGQHIGSGSGAGAGQHATSGAGSGAGSTSSQHFCRHLKIGSHFASAVSDRQAVLLTTMTASNPKREKRVIKSSPSLIQGAIVPRVTRSKTPNAQRMQRARC